LHEIYLIRHGAIENPQALACGRRPGFPLSKQGIREAGETAGFLTGSGIEAIFHSPLERCVQTASIIASVLQVPVVEAGEVNEWAQNESLRDVQARMNTFYMTLYAQVYDKLAVVSHRDPLRVLMLSLSGRGLSDIYRPEVLPLPTGAVYLLKPTQAGVSLENLFSPPR
jgi:broad specificity phosphatase PhoE